jgi:GH15 family glucan-1,4-alpha-glucosidase
VRWSVDGARRPTRASGRSAAAGGTTRTHQAGYLAAPAAKFRREREAIQAAVGGRGYHAGLGSYVSVFDGDELNASLLLLSRYRYAEPTSSRMLGTCARVHERLGVNGLLCRYTAADGLPAGEGVFGIASFWAVDCRLR